MRIQSLLCIVLLLTILEATAANDFTLKTVVIDAGHGGKDPGATGPGKTLEKDVALSVALKLGAEIKKNYPDVNVIFTRKTDVFIELHERAEIANHNKADLFISVHYNSATNPQAYDSNCYVLGLHRTEANLDVAKRENSVILLEDNRDKNYEFDPNTPEGHIIMSMKQNAFLDQSISIASKVEESIENSARRKSRGVKQAGFYVLYKTTMPSILAEIGFISNPDEEKFLKSNSGQDKIANALFNAFSEYKKDIEQSEGEQYAYEEAKKIQSDTGKNDKEIMAAAKNVVSDPKKDDKKTEIQPAAETKSITEAITDTNFVTLASGKKIKKPSESESGGGTIVVAVPTPEAKKAEPAPVASKEEIKSSPTKSNEEVKENKETATPPVRPAPEKNTPPAVTEKTEVKSGSNNGVVFKIQLFALRGELKDRDKLIKLFGSVTSDPLPNGITRYYGGNAKDYPEAIKLLNTAKSNGYSSSFIVGFQKGERLNSEQMKEYIR